MIIGIPPFFDRDRDRLFNRILKSQIHFPSEIQIPDVVIDFIKCLLIIDPKKRLGGKNGAGDVKKHKWFYGIQWDRLLNKDYNPPFIPKMIKAEDTNYIEKGFLKEMPIDSYVPSYKDGTHYDEWSYNYKNEINN